MFGRRFSSRNRASSPTSPPTPADCTRWSMRCCPADCALNTTDRTIRAMAVRKTSTSAHSTEKDSARRRCPEVSYGRMSGTQIQAYWALRGVLSLLNRHKLERVPGRFPEGTKDTSGTEGQSRNGTHERQDSSYSEMKGIRQEPPIGSLERTSATKMCGCDLRRAQGQCQWSLARLSRQTDCPG